MRFIFCAIFGGSAPGVAFQVGFGRRTDHAREPPLRWLRGSATLALPRDLVSPPNKPPMTLTYDLLQSLQGGSASVAEHLTADQRRSLWVETPVAEYLREAASCSPRRHLFLTGSAGDGKTTLLREISESFDPDEWHLCSDASDRNVPDLAEGLSEELRAGRYLLVAINRGQLERLEDYVSECDEHEGLRVVLETVAACMELRVRWTDSDRERAAGALAIDLSLQETLAEEVVSRVLERALSTALPEGPWARQVFQASVEALSCEGVQSRVHQLLRVVSSHGRQVTMRDLWSFVSHLLTGGHSGTAAEAPLGAGGLREAVGARVFGQPVGVGQVLLAQLICDAGGTADPARAAWPSLTADLLRKGLPTVLQGLVGLDGLALSPLELPEAELSDLGAAAVRTAWVHGHAMTMDSDWEPTAENAQFPKLVNALKNEADWVHDPQLAHTLVSDLSALAGQPSVQGQPLAWRVLAYEVRRRQVAPFLAGDVIKLAEVHLGLPRPHPDVEQALGDRYRVPFVWIGVGVGEGPRLRLTPSLVSAMTERRGPATAARVGVRAWLDRLPVARSHEVRIRPREGRGLSIQQSILDGTKITMDGGDHA